MKFDSKKFRELTEENFEYAWNKGREVISPREPNQLFPRYGYPVGEAHPLFKTINDLRRAYMSIGFKEVVNPIIIEDRHIKKQFGKEALAVLDRCYYLASLPRPNIGISSDRIEEIGNIVGREIENKEVEQLQEIFHSFKKGKVDGDDLTFEMGKILNTEDTKAVRILDEVFPEFKEIKPQASNLTLRSHMTAGWFITLSKIADKFPPPIRLFSIDRCFRKEQGEDAARLYTYFSASCAIVDEDVSVDDGKAVSEALLRQFGFEKFKFKEDEKRSKYYIPGTQTEVFAFHPEIVGSNTKYSDGWMEIATFGIYSPTALSQYNIEYPVMNLGLGVERLALVLSEESDVRELVYPWLYDKIELSDMDIARAIKVKEVPQTTIGLRIAEKIVSTAEEHANEKSPCEFLAFDGELYGKRMRVYVTEKEENTKLCGPAYLNEVVVHQGNIYGLPRKDKWMSYFDHGITTNMRYIDAFAHLAARRIEEGVAADEEFEVKGKVVEGLSDINLSLEDNVRKYVISNNYKIDVRGPFFVAVRVELA